ncbi:hypothetical protein IWW55_002591, partial [Coemansia sp. RSA 2706]
SEQLQKQLGVVSKTLPLIALDYIKAAADAYNTARTNLVRYGRGFTFSFSNLPFALDQKPGKNSKANVIQT